MTPTFKKTAVVILVLATLGVAAVLVRRGHGARSPVAAPASSPAPAPVPTAATLEQSAVKLAGLTQVSRIRDDIVAQREKMIETAVDQVLAGKPATAADKAALDACRAQIETAVDREFSKAKIEGMFAKIYAQTFTQEEVNGLIAFYGTPTGQALASKQLKINDQAGLAFQRGFGDLNMKLQMAMISAYKKIQAAHAPKVEPAAAAKSKAPLPYYPNNVVRSNLPAMPAQKPAAAASPAPAAKPN
jgi:hypothetical protein